MAALVVNFIIGVMKLVVGILTVSSAMIAEAAHSFADTFNQILLAVGIRVSRRDPDLEHPFGYHKNQFFWAFVVAVLIFGISGTFAIYEGIEKIMHHDDHKTEGFIWNIIVLVIAIFLESFALRTAFKEAKEYQKKLETDSMIEAIDEMQDPVLLSLLVEDSLALIGLTVALIGVVITFITGNPVIDGITSIVIGVILVVGGVLLARENKTYLIGKAVNEKTKTLIDKIVQEHETVEKLVARRTMLLAPKAMLVTLDVIFVDGADEAEEIDKLEAKLIEAIPYLKAQKIFIEAQ